MFKAISLSSLAALGLAALYSPAALADCTTQTDSEWECLEIGNGGSYTDHTDHTHLDGPFTFQGPANLYHTLTGTITGCTLTVAGKVDVRPAPTNEAYIEVTNATSSGPGTCGSISFSGFNWQATVPGANHGDVHDAGGEAGGAHDHNAFGDMTGVTIRYNTILGPVTICQGTLANVEFGNDVTGSGNKNNKSFFRFNGSIPGSIGNCGVSGTVIVINGSGYDDVNAW